ncbi:DUF3795 domain-containing protein [bacterium]|nr:DUF3795 domain-containing protein [bacterium]
MLVFGGYCGLDCDTCPALIATRKDFKATDPGTIPCGGCYAAPSDVFRCCFEDCGIRICARERGVPTCAECPEYVCSKLDEFFFCFPNGGEAKRNLDSRRNA